MTKAERSLGKGATACVRLDQKISSERISSDTKQTLRSYHAVSH